MSKIINGCSRDLKNKRWGGIKGCVVFFLSGVYVSWSGRRLCSLAQSKNRQEEGEAGGGGETANTIAFKCIIHWGRIEGEIGWREVEIPLWCGHILCVWEKKTVSVNMWGCLWNKQKRAGRFITSDPAQDVLLEFVYWTVDSWNR